MKKLIALTALAALSTSGAFAGSSYVTGNVQLHNESANEITSTLEAGHTFDTGTTLLVEFDGINLGEYRDASGKADPAITLGAEHALNINQNLWVAAGYHHLLQNGEAIQYRPLIKVGYNFDNGVYVSNRTRFHFDAESKDLATTRFDNAIGYNLTEVPLGVKYNNVFQANDGKANTMDHELRATWTRTGVQPYFELRSQGHGGDSKVNTALVFGASYGF